MAALKEFRLVGTPITVKGLYSREQRDQLWQMYLDWNKKYYSRTVAGWDLHWDGGRISVISTSRGMDWENPEFSAALQRGDPAAVEANKVMTLARLYGGAQI